MKKYIQIRSGVNPQGDNFLDDVVQVKRSLQSLGYYKEPKYGLTEFPDNEMFSGIRKFQKEKNLRVDGILRPDGETQKAIDSELRNKLGARSPTLWCTECGGPHGGVYGSVCHWCIGKA